jgi:hypothetical protein
MTQLQLFTMEHADFLGIYLTTGTYISIYGTDNN